MINVTIKQSNTKWPFGRPQRWYWVARAGNGKTMARSSEMYTNRTDCVNAALHTLSMAVTVFDPDGKRLYEITQAQVMDA